jgi:hypothetical protein
VLLSATQESPFGYFLELRYGKGQMAQLIEFPTFSDPRGSLTVMEKELPFSPKRFFTIYDFKGPRGGHGHLRSRMMIYALSGALKIEVRTKGKISAESEFFTLDSPRTGLYLNPEDWHELVALSEGTLALCVSSELYSKDDYFYEKP